MKIFYRILQVKSIWLNERKRKFVNLLEEGLTIDSVIMSEDYYATPIDYILIFKQVKLPVIFYTSTKHVMNNEGLLKTLEAIEYTFIKVSSLDMSDMPSYRIIVGKDGLHVPVANFSVDERKEIEDLPVFDVSEYLKPTTVLIKRKARNLVPKKAKKV